MGTALGLNFHHDTSACLIVDGRIIAAEEERWSGVKHNRSRREDYLTTPNQALQFCLDEAGAKPGEIDVVWACSMAPVAEHDSPSGEERELLASQLPDPLGKRLRLMSHHAAHIMSGFPLAGVERAAGLVIDAGGSALSLPPGGRERISGFSLDCGRLRRVHQGTPTWDDRTPRAPLRREHSLGHYYRNMSLLCIPPGDEPEGSMMALAALGDAARYRDAVRPLVRLEDEGQVRVDPTIASYRAETALTLDERPWRHADAATRPMQDRADLAAAAQERFEEAVVHIASRLRTLTGADTLVFSGGCALNGRLNASLAERAGFASLFVPPAPHDAGTALGAALFGWCCDLRRAPPEPPASVAWGPSPGPMDFDALDGRFDVMIGLGRDEMIARVVNALTDGLIVGWVRGGMEFGPRALGHRSIIAHPGSRAIRDRLNRIKQRAGYRPFAPSVAAKEARTYFDSAPDCFMNRTARVRPQYRDRLAGATHVDGTARAQAVEPRDGDFGALLDAFGRRAGVPVLLNTSLNLKGAPIVRTARQAVDAFVALSLDALAVTDTLIVRRNAAGDPGPRSLHI